MIVEGDQSPGARHALVFRLLGGLVGGLVGFALAAGLYVLVNPVFEDSDLQGLLWNVVPFGTVAGFALGLAVVRRWR